MVDTDTITAEMISAAEMRMSHVQWGAFVSSFGDGTGVPAIVTQARADIEAMAFEAQQSANRQLGNAIAPTLESGEQA